MNKHNLTQEEYAAIKCQITKDLIDEGYVVANPKKKVGVHLSKPRHRENWEPKHFKIFWKAYPRKTGKDGAIRAWNRLKPCEALMNEMYIHYSQAYTSTEKQFIPHASTYLNQARWNDEIINNEKNSGNKSTYNNGQSALDKVASSISGRN